MNKENLSTKKQVKNVALKKIVNKANKIEKLID